jgi:hypothetical protein
MLLIEVVYKNLIKIDNYNIYKKIYLRFRLNLSIMDIDKFINDNIEDILDNQTFFISAEPGAKVNIYEGEDLEEQEDIIDLQDVHEMLERKKEKEKTIKDNVENVVEEDPEYYFKLINIFMKFYNNKYNKNENLFSNIADKDKDTNSALELFFEAIMEFKDLKEKLNIDEIDLLDIYYDSDNKEIINLMNSYEQVYCLEINEDKKKIVTISLIICLNYILINKIEKWNIFMLKNY